MAEEKKDLSRHGMEEYGDDYPEPERLITPEEEAGMDLESLDNPPQAEGDRDVDEDIAERKGRLSTQGITEAEGAD